MVVVFHSLRTVAGLVDGWSVGHTGSLVHLNNSIVGQFLDATHFSCLNGRLVLLGTDTFGPIGGLPIRWTGFRVATQLVLVYDWFVEVYALLRGRDFRGTLSDTLDDRRLDSAATSLGTCCEFHYFPREFASSDFTVGLVMGNCLVS